MKKRKAAQPPVDKNRDYSERLVELFTEIRAKPASAIPSITGIERVEIAQQPVIRFTHKGKHYAVGFFDKVFEGSNQSRGIRTIQFYDDAEQVVLSVVGEFENREFGDNFQWRRVDGLTEGSWEEHFILITEGIRTFRADRKEEMRRRRAAQFPAD